LSHAFINGVVRMLEYDPRIVIERRELHNPPRPIREEELREARQERLYGEQFHPGDPRASARGGA